MNRALRPTPANAWSCQRVAVAGALAATLVGNWPLWRAVAGLDDYSVASRAALVAALAFGSTALLVLLLSALAWRATIRPALGFVFVSTALMAHFIGSYGVVIDPQMMRNAIQTDLREVRDLVGAGLVAHLLLLGVLPAALVWRIPLAAQTWRRALLRNGLLAAGAIAIALGSVFTDFADLASLMRGRPEVRFMITPLNGFYALARQGGSARARIAPPAPTPYATDATLAARRRDAKPPLLLLVIGETARADRFGVNGYGRDTTPELARRDVVSFAAVTSCGTDTASSLPCMLSLQDRDGHLALPAPQENLLDVLQRAGLAVLWLDNQSGCKGLCDRVPHARLRDRRPPPPLCGPGGECFDAGLLHGLEERLAALDPVRRARGVVLVLHPMGSHGPAYFARTPAEHKPFLPECRSVSLRSCDKAALDNTYDNTIAYTDHVLGLAIDWLARQGDRYDPALFYVADHGESLGEHSIYLHGMPWRIAPREQTHVPWIVWWPAATARSSGVSLACLQARRDAALTHSQLAHTTLAWMGVQTSAYRHAADAFAPCRATAH
ncbi:MAG TPA: sulfatase-like hydrolase/transferase [Burkholderiaceae bacterium]|nr:sulfatase-like hydrolase/transferase [Burkholderiaceae bacterium]